MKRNKNEKTGNDYSLSNKLLTLLLNLNLNFEVKIMMSLIL